MSSTFSCFFQKQVKNCDFNTQFQSKFFFHSWVLFIAMLWRRYFLQKYRNMPVPFVKVSELNIAYRRIIHLFPANYYSTFSYEIFHTLCNGTLIICRKHVDDAVILLSRYFEVPVCSNTFTKSIGVKVWPHKSTLLRVFFKLLPCRLTIFIERVIIRR